MLHAAIIREPGTGEPRGFGFIHFPDAATARAASEGMNGRLMDGKPLLVKLRNERGSASAQGPREPMQHQFDDAKLYVSHLPDFAADGEIRELFARVAVVRDVRLIVDRETGRSKGYAFVTMESKAAADAAMAQMDGYRWGESSLSVRIAGERRCVAFPSCLPLLIVPLCVLAVLCFLSCESRRGAQVRRICRCFLCGCVLAVLCCGL